MTVEETPQYAAGYAQGAIGGLATSVDPGYLAGHADGWRVWLRIAPTRLVGVVT